VNSIGRATAAAHAAPAAQPGVFTLDALNHNMIGDNVTIDYAKMQREFPKQKRALTLALKSGDYAKVVATTRRTIIEWNETGAWPDDWAHWERCLDDAWWAAKSRYVRGELDEMPAHVSVNSIADELKVDALMGVINRIVDAKVAAALKTD
jgi:hypothetical protein